MEGKDHRIRLNDEELEYLLHVPRDYAGITLPENRPDHIPWEEWRFGLDLYDRFSAVLKHNTYAKRSFATRS